MKKLLLLSTLAALSLVASAAVTQQAVAGKDTLSLTDESCTMPRAELQMDAADFAHAKRALAVIQGHKFEACYVILGETVGILYEDGDISMLPVQAFKPVSEV